MLSYAWSKWKEVEKINVGLDDFEDALNLLTRVFTNGCDLLLKRNLDKLYQPITEQYFGIKGKIDFNASLADNTFIRGKAICTFDEYTEDIPLNRIIKAVLERLMNMTAVDKSLRDRVRIQYRKMNKVGTIKLLPIHFHQVQLHRNNQFYKLLLNVGLLIVENSAVDSKSGAYMFKDFSKSPREMGIIFEEFVRKFYYEEQEKFIISREKINWQVDAISSGDLNLLPEMQTDISAQSSLKKLIIDTKFYSKTLDGQFDNKKFYSSNLYQLYSYLKNLELDTRNPLNLNSDGILLYPKIDKDLDEEYIMGNHKIRIVTIDLSCNWEVIHNRLLDILMTD